MGSIFHLSIYMMERAAAAISHCRRHGVRVMATTPSCDDALVGSNFAAPCAVAVGNEADGLSHELLAGADSRIRIEIFGMAESLDIALATGIALHAMAVKEHKPDAAKAKKRRKAAKQ